MGGRHAGAHAWAAAMGLALALAGCKSTTGMVAGSPDVIRAEDGCDVPGLSAPLRQTVVMLDARAIQPSASAAEFVARNSGLRDLLLSIAEPGRIQSSGVTAMRERVTIAIVPLDGSPAQQIFTGCPPGLSAAELAEARNSSSAMGEFFTGSVADKFASQGEAFSLKLIGGLNAAGMRAAAGGTPTGAIDHAPFLAGVAASRALMETKNNSLRLILVTDLSAFAPAGGFLEGLAAGRAAGGQLSLAQVHLVAPAGRPVAHKAFLQGWLLGQGAQLASAGAGRVATVTAPPRRLWSFQGTVAYPTGGEPVVLRIGDDGAGKLAGAWLTMRGTPDRSTPMTGTIACSVADHCTIQSDDGGFAQVWNPKPGAEPSFGNDWPFAGMRRFAFELRGNQLTGKVYDDDVHIGDSDRNALAIEATRR